MAEIPVRCPECNKKIELDESWVNHDVQCRHCGQTFLFSQYLVPEGYSESVKKRKIFLLAAFGILITGLCIFFGIRHGSKMRARRISQEQRSRRFYSGKRYSRNEDVRDRSSRRVNSEDSSAIATQQDLEKYIQTSTQPPQRIIRRAFYQYGQLMRNEDSTVEKPLTEMLEKRFRMDLDPAETALSDLKYEVQERIKTEFPVSIREYAQEMKEEAKKKYPLAQAGTVIEIKSLRDGAVKGILNGFSQDRSRIYVDGKSYAVSDLTQSSGILVNSDLNREARERFAEEKTSLYQEKIQQTAKNLLAQRMEEKGYIHESGRFYSPSEYLDSLKYGNANSVSSGRRYSPSPRRRRTRRRFRRANIESNSAGSQNLSIPSRSSRLTEHIQYYRRGDSSDHNGGYRDPHKKYIRTMR